MNLLKDCKFYQIAALSTGDTDIQGTPVDAAGYDGVCFIASFFGNTNSTGGYSILRYQHASSSESTSMASCGDTSDSEQVAMPASTAIGIVDDSMLILDVPKIANRYVTAYVTKDSSNAVNLAVYGLLYKGNKVPVTQPTSTLGVAGSAIYPSPTS